MLKSLFKPKHVIIDIVTGKYYSAPNTPGEMFSDDPEKALKLSYWDALGVSRAISIQGVATGTFISTRVIKI